MTSSRVAILMAMSCFPPTLWNYDIYYCATDMYTEGSKHRSIYGWKHAQTCDFHMMDDKMDNIRVYKVLRISEGLVGGLFWLGWVGNLSEQPVSAVETTQSFLIATQNALATWHKLTFSSEYVNCVMYHYRFGLDHVYTHYSCGTLRLWCILLFCVWKSKLQHVEWLHPSIWRLR